MRTIKEFKEMGKAKKTFGATRRALKKDTNREINQHFIDEAIEAEEMLDALFYMEMEEEMEPSLY